VRWTNHNHRTPSGTDSTKRWTFSLIWRTQAERWWNPNHLAAVVILDHQIRVLTRKLGFDDTEGESDGS
jgi:hypothetical protein